MGSTRSVFVVDDQLTARTLLAELAQGADQSVETRMFASAADAIDAAKKNPPELLLTDYRMPGIDGLTLIRIFRELEDCREVPIIMVTSHSDRKVRNQALQVGATDFLEKPVDPIECRARCANLLKMHKQHLILKDRANWLENQVLQAVKTVRYREKETLRLLAKAGEYRNEETGDHVARMARYSRLIAETLSLPAERCNILEHAAPMHDIGKIGIPDCILLKPGKHTEEEASIMQDHTIIGYRILKDSNSKYVQMGSVIAHCHHEHYDGKGYPQGLVGEEIPLSARIVAVADVFDALTSKRPYKEAWPVNTALEYIVNQKNKHLDPECVEAFLTHKKSLMSFSFSNKDEFDYSE